MRDLITNEYIVPEWETVPCPVCGSTDIQADFPLYSSFSLAYLKKAYMALLRAIT